MKKYTLEIFLDDGVSYHEKLEGSTITEVRNIISILEEIKTRFVLQIIQLGKEVDLKKLTRQ